MATNKDLPIRRGGFTPPSTPASFLASAVKDANDPTQESLEAVNLALKRKIEALRIQITESDSKRADALNAVAEKRIRNKRRKEFWAAFALPTDHAIYVCSDDSQDEDERLGRPLGTSTSLLELGVSAFESSDNRSAKRLFKHSALRAFQAGDKKAHVMACVKLSNVYAKEEKHDKCHALVRHWLSELRQLKDQQLEATMLGEAVSCSMALGRFDEALGLGLRKLILSNSETETMEASEWVDKINVAIDADAATATE